MAEEMTSGVGPEPEVGPTCPWCSAPLPASGLERCPSCGAALHEVDAAEVPGVTRVDHEALLRSRAPAQRSRGLVGWLSGEYAAEAPDAPLGSFEPPDEAVRREMLRLEMAALEAEIHAREAEAAAMAAAAAEQQAADFAATASVAAPEDAADAASGDAVAAPDEVVAAPPDAAPDEERAGS